MNRPHKNCYWVTPAKLMAGEYPISDDLETGRQKLSAILAAGIDEFLDLTGPADGLYPYLQMDQFGYRQMTIRDMDVPDVAHMRDILAHLSQRLEQGRTVYVHCWGGIGRTGTVIGCHLIEQGLAPEQALAHIAERWPTMEKYRRFPRSPQTEAQVDFVRGWVPITRA